jgi:predicted phage terminase large subunit-like protein
MGPYTFATQMLQNPKADETQGFLTEWLHYQDNITPTGLNVYMMFDPASGKRSNNDYTAGWVVGLGTDENVYVLDIVRDRLNLPQRAELIMRWHRKYKPIQVRYEKYGMMADIEYILELQKKEKYRFEIIEVAGKVPKSDRIKRLIPYLAANRFIFPTWKYYTDYEGTTVDLMEIFREEEYKSFPVSQHDDMLDALARLFEPDLTLIWPKEIKKSKPRAKEESWESW